jgi:hypothetical protein
MALVSLTRGFHAIIDDDLLDACHGMGLWQASVTNWGVYAVKKRRRPETGKIYLHRWVMGDPPGVLIDHRNGVTLDCRRGNLRRASNSQNIHNSVTVKGAVPFRGVHRLKDGRFCARIMFHGKHITLGAFLTADEASSAYETKRIELQGEFAPISRLQKETGHGL